MFSVFFKHATPFSNYKKINVLIARQNKYLFVEDMVFCGKYGIVGDIAHPTAVEYPGAATCPNGSLASPESFVLKHCQTNSSQGWTPGYDVRRFVNGNLLQKLRTIV